MFRFLTYITRSRHTTWYAPSLFKIYQKGIHSTIGGIYGWDRRNWTIITKSKTSVTYHHRDAADEGFPGNVTAFVRVTHLFLKAKLEEYLRCL